MHEPGYSPASTSHAKILYAAMAAPLSFGTSQLTLRTPFVTPAVVFRSGTTLMFVAGSGGPAAVVTAIATDG